MSNNIVLVTGFGPFGEHKINASWESVCLLPQQIDDFTIITEEIPVAYGAVDEIVSQLWEKHKPQLVIHVGVSSLANKITLETCAYKQGYNRVDVFGCKPQTGNQCAAECGEKCLQGGLNCDEICTYLNQTDIKACTSNNAGRYLCEYIYYTSLSVNKNRAMFVHVPKLGEPYTAEQLASGLTDIIKCALKQIKN